MIEQVLRASMFSAVIGSAAIVVVNLPVYSISSLAFGIVMLPVAFVFAFVLSMPNKGIPFSHRSPKIESFYGKVPYLVRESGNAFIIFTELRASFFREEKMNILSYMYIDQDIFFTFSTSPREGINLRGVSNYGFREASINRELWTIKANGELVNKKDLESEKDAPYSWLSYPIWLKTLHALGDAWPAWQESKSLYGNIDKKVQNGDRTSHVGDYGPTGTCGFCAGISNMWFKVRYLDG